MAESESDEYSIVSTVSPRWVLVWWYHNEAVELSNNSVVCSWNCPIKVDGSRFQSLIVVDKNCFYAALRPHIASHSVCPSVPLSLPSVTSFRRPLASRMYFSARTDRGHPYFSARTEGRISYGHLGRTDSCFYTVDQSWLDQLILKCISITKYKLHFF